MITQPRFSEEAGDDQASDGDPVARLRLQLDELQAYARQQWAARTDRLWLGVRRLFILAALGAVALIAGSAWIVTTIVLLLQGAVGGVSAAMNCPLWLASLIVAAAAMTLVAIGVAVVYASWVAASSKRTRQRYEDRRREQRSKFGHSAKERAT